MVPVGDVLLDVETVGSGEPVMVIQTALVANELRPLCGLLAGAGEYRVIHCHRRGYAGSGPIDRPRSITDEAADAAAAIEALHVAPAHVVGASFSAAIGLTLAAMAPDLVRTLAVVEPPPTGTPGTEEFRATNRDLHDTHAHAGPRAALDQFMAMLTGPDWRDTSERELPGSVTAMERDAATFFGSDVPALASWSFSDREAARVRCPVLCVGGRESGAWFTEMRAHLGDLLPTADITVVDGAGHLLASTHAELVADLLIRHLRRHS